MFNILESRTYKNKLKNIYRLCTLHDFPIHNNNNNIIFANFNT